MTWADRGRLTHLFQLCSVLMPLHVQMDGDDKLSGAALSSAVTCMMTAGCHKMLPTCTNVGQPQVRQQRSQKPKSLAYHKGEGHKPVIAVTHAVAHHSAVIHLHQSTSDSARLQSCSGSSEFNTRQHTAGAMLANEPMMKKMAPK